MIVLLSPIFNDDLCLMPVGEDPAIETFSAKLTVEALDKRVLPWTTGLDVQGAALPIAQPLLQGVGDKFRTIVAAQVVGCAPQQKEPFQLLDDLARRDGAGDVNRQALPRVLVEHRQHPQLATALGAGFQKVIGPDLVGMTSTSKLAR